MTKKRPWNADWEKVHDLDGGGQGIVSVVRARGDLEGAHYVLKRLRRQDDPERRKRMYREVAALRTFDNLGIPKIITSNVDQFENPHVPLFLVQEYIQGHRLSDEVDKQLLPLSDALAMIRSLLQIVRYSHERGVVHRDIKPDN
ncbi:MAG: protein kinase domain-containing protein, partial [Phycisphaeraceae bacterium]